MPRQVLDEAEIRRAIARISYEVLEYNKGADDLVVLGIPTRGVPLARRMTDRIAEIEPSARSEALFGQLDVTMHRDDLGRNPIRPIAATEPPAGGIDDKTVVLVDDVLYSGRTIRSALDALSDLGRAAVVRLAVLVDRGHREFPIRADHVGKNLPTATAERVDVRLVETDGRDSVEISDS